MKIKNLRGECQHCGGVIEFHAEHAGGTADCPHCGQATELFLATPAEESSPLGKKPVFFFIIAALILLGGLVATNYAFKRAKRMKAAQQIQAQPANTSPADPFAANGFRVSTAIISKADGSTITHATGSIVNTSNRQRFGVRVELELQDAAGAKVGSASDYQKVMEVGATWSFRALVVEKNAAAAKIISVTETVK
jgi:rRNA maturation protein Nop10